MSLWRFLESRGIPAEAIDKMKEDKIVVDIIAYMSDEDLCEYLPNKCDRVAMKAFARREESETENDKRKLSLIQSLRKRMKFKKTSHLKDASDTEDEEGTDTMDTASLSSRRRHSLNAKQAGIASKNDRALAVGFSINNGVGYRQVRAPMGGDIRHPRVSKNATKEELLEKIRPLFFPDGKSCHGPVSKFIFDISTDVNGHQLMHERESVKCIMTRLGLKHLRCYLLAKVPSDDSSGSMITMPYMVKTDLKKRTTDTHKTTNYSSLIINEASTSTAMLNNTQISASDLPDIGYSRETPVGEQQGLFCNDEFIQTEVTVVTRDDANEGENLYEDPHGRVFSEIHDASTSTLAPNDDTELRFLPGGEDTLSNAVNSRQHSFASQDFLMTAVDDSGVIYFEPLPHGVVDDLDDTLPLVTQITVHRGLICHDLMDFFSQEKNVQSSHFAYEIRMLKEDGTPEIAEDNGGLMRDALSEFWETFYLQFTEGNISKIPVLRHDMTEVKWKPVAAVIKMGFMQADTYPIKLSQCFMQQAIFGTCTDFDLIDSFLSFVSEMDKTVLQSAMKDFATVDIEDLHDVMEQYEAKRLITCDNIESVVREIAHKELIQKPLFVADCFYKLLHNSSLVQEDLSLIYERMRPTPKKVLKSLTFPEQMTEEETRLSLHIKKLVREMDDPEYLGLFLRFCTGSDIITKNAIHVRFTSSDVSANVRCPTSHTCGCILEVPRSYAQDPYVALKADFLALLKTRYWQMDIV